MFRHVVVFRFTEDASQAARQAVREGLAALPAQIDVIRRYQFGNDAGLAEGNFDFAVVADFDDVAAYQIYAQHDAHQTLIAERIRPILAERVAVQYTLD
jgi:hypothetical protein